MPDPLDSIKSPELTVIGIEEPLWSTDAIGAKGQAFTETTTKLPAAFAPVPVTCLGGLELTVQKVTVTRELRSLVDRKPMD